MLLACAWWQDGFTGLHHGVQNGKLEVVQLLLEHKANVNLANKVVGRNTFPEYFYVWLSPTTWIAVFTLSMES